MRRKKFFCLICIFVLSACSAAHAEVMEFACDSSVAELQRVYYDTFINTREVDDLENYSDLIVVGTFVKQLDSRVLNLGSYLVTTYVFVPEKIIKGVSTDTEVLVDVMGGCLSSEDFLKQVPVEAKKIPSERLLEEKYPDGFVVVEQGALVVQNFGTNPSNDPTQRYILYLSAPEDPSDAYSVLLFTHGFKTINGSFVYSDGNEGETAEPFLLSSYEGLE